MPIVHYHSSDARFCGSTEMGREWSQDPSKVTCRGCLGISHAQDRNVLHPAVEEACQEIDAQLFSGDTSDEQCDRLEYMVDRWKRRIAEARQFNEEFAKENPENV